MAAVTTSLCLLLWLPDFVGLNWSETSTLPGHWNYDHSCCALTCVFLLSTFATTLINGLLVSLLSFKLSITWYRSVFPMNLYLLGMGVLTELHTRVELQLGLMACIVSVLVIYEVMKSKVAIEEGLQLGLCLATATALVPSYSLLLPLYLIFMITLRVFTPKVVLAYLLGILSIGVLISTYFFFSGTVVLYLERLHEIWRMTDINAFGWNIDNLYIWLLLGGIIAPIVTFYVNFYTLKTQNRSSLNVLSVLCAVCGLLFVLNESVFMDMRPLLLLCTSIFFAYFFHTRASWFRYVMFWLFVLVHLTYFILSILEKSALIKLIG